MPIKKHFLYFLNILWLPLSLSALYSQASLAAPSETTPSEKPKNEDGTIQIPPAKIPTSIYMSEVARRQLANILQRPPDNHNDGDINALRESTDRDVFAPLLARAKAMFSTKIESASFGQVKVDVVTPLAGIPEKNKNRVLINLHGGSFMFGEGMGGLIESIPIASLGGFKVISVKYRLGPEHEFPAGSQDVATVYQELLAQYAPENIGIYGCSSGGNLTSMATVWFQKHGLPAPGAIGIFCAPADEVWGGDSSYIAPLLTGEPVPETSVSKTKSISYLKNANIKDALVSPVFSPSVLSKFPPTLLITGTRSREFSAVAFTHSQLIKAGATAELHVWDGMWHGFIYDVDLPESIEAFNVITKFFNKYLAGTKR